MAERLLASVFFLPRVMSLSATRWASFALCHVVEMDSCSMSDVTRFRSSALRCAEFLLKCRYLIAPPAMIYALRRRFSLLQVSCVPSLFRR